MAEPATHFDYDSSESRDGAVMAADGNSVIKDSEHRIKSSTEKTLYRMELLDGSGNVQQTRDIELYYK